MGAEDGNGNRYNFVEMIKRRVGRVVIIERAPSIDGNARWRYKCDCGRTAIDTGIAIRAAEKNAARDGRPCGFACPECRPRKAGTVTRRTPAAAAVAEIKQGRALALVVSPPPPAEGGTVIAVPFYPKKNPPRSTSGQQGRGSGIDKFRRLVTKHESAEMGRGTFEAGASYWQGFDKAIALFELAFDVRLRE